MSIYRVATSEPRKHIVPSAPQAKLQSEIRIMEDYQQRALTRITARNLSGEAVDRIEVYMSGRERSILGTDFRPGHPVEDIESQFFSSTAAIPPYTFTAMVSQGKRRYSSGELTVHKSGFLDIDIHKTMVVMNHYANRERTVLIASQVLTMTPVHPRNGNHPLV